MRRRRYSFKGLPCEAQIRLLRSEQKSFPVSLIFYPGQWEGNYPAGVFHLLKKIGTVNGLPPLTGSAKWSIVQMTRRVKPTLN